MEKIIFNVTDFRHEARNRRVAIVVKFHGQRVQGVAYRHCLGVTLAEALRLVSAILFVNKSVEIHVEDMRIVIKLP